MALVEIPQMNYAIDGDMISIQQGEIEVSYISLHRLHIEHLAKALNIGLPDNDNASPVLVDYLERINEQAEALYAFLDSVPSLPPSDKLDEDVMMAKTLYETANRALGLWGNN